jgi:hypothetical protein
VTIFTVSNTAALTSALKAAHGGDTITLASGTYTGLAINNINIAGGVTITSADPAHQAVLNNFNIVGSSGLKFANVEMVATGSTNTFAFQVNNSNNVTFDHVKMHGSLDGNAQNDANGLQVLNSSKIAVTNSEFQQLGRAVGFGASSDLNVTDNTVHHIRSDGFDFAEVSFVKIVGNVMHSFSPATGDHPDAIQFWTAGTKTASHDIVISGNVIMKGDGSGSMQGIFMGDETGKMPFEHLTVSNNLIVGTGYNALRINGVKDLQINGNELVSTPGELNRTSILIQNATTVNATGNKAFAFGWDKITSLTQSGNVATAVVTDGAPWR